MKIFFEFEVNQRLNSILSCPDFEQLARDIIYFHVIIFFVSQDQKEEEFKLSKQRDHARKLKNIHQDQMVWLLVLQFVKYLKENEGQVYFSPNLQYQLFRTSILWDLVFNYSKSFHILIFGYVNGLNISETAGTI